MLEIAGALAYGTTREQAIANAQALGLRVMAERLEHGEDVPDLAGVFSIAACINLAQRSAAGAGGAAEAGVGA